MDTEVSMCFILSQVVFVMSPFTASHLRISGERTLHKSHRAENLHHRPSVRHAALNTNPNVYLPLFFQSITTHTTKLLLYQKKKAVEKKNLSNLSAKSFNKDNPLVQTAVRDTQK